MVSFPPVSPPRPYSPPFPHPYAPHTQPISFFSILSPAQYWVRSTNHLAPRYAISITKALLVTTVHGKCRHLNSALFYSRVLARPSRWIEAFQGQYILFVFRQDLLIHEVSRSHMTTLHSRVISSSQRPLPDNTHNRHTSMHPVEFEPTIPAGERPQTYASDRTATGIGKASQYYSMIYLKVYAKGTQMTVTTLRPELKPRRNSNSLRTKNPTFTNLYSTKSREVRQNILRGSLHFIGTIIQ